MCACGWHNDSDTTETEHPAMTPQGVRDEPTDSQKTTVVVPMANNSGEKSNCTLVMCHRDDAGILIVKIVNNRADKNV